MGNAVPIQRASQSASQHVGPNVPGMGSAFSTRETLSGTSVSLLRLTRTHSDREIALYVDRLDRPSPSSEQYLALARQTKALVDVLPHLVHQRVLDGMTEQIRWLTPRHKTDLLHEAKILFLTALRDTIGERLPQSIPQGFDSLSFPHGERQ
jgi:hypothetical protein